MRRVMLAMCGVVVLIGCGAPAAQRAPETPAGNDGGARRDPWSEARGRGIDVRAVGQEPGWFLDIDHGNSMHLVYDYAERTATVPAPEPVTSGATTTYEAATSEHRVRVILEERPCQDVMSGEPFPLTVTVEIDARMLRGCGRPL
jgi:uncharacterized membrane protein